MKLTKLLFLCISAVFFSVVAQAQDRINVSGNVVDDTGLPVPGATITEKGTQNATLSDIDGKYSLNVSSNGTLVISFIGFATQEVVVGGKNVINAKLMPSSQSLEEVVVVGYGVQKKSVVTGSISSVKATQIEDQPVTRIEQTLQGRVSGVTISANAGQPGSSSTIRIRGITTFNNNDPLWVVDGIIVDNGGIAYLNQSDIESIEVLKDGASAAIYGTRGATGVILVTTKKGKAGKMNVTYNGYTGVSSAARRLDLLDATQYATLRNEMYMNDFNQGAGTTPQLPYPNPSSYGAGTNWQDQIFKTAQRQSHNLSFSGGNDKSTYYASFGYLDQEGIVLPEISNWNRKNLTINSTHKITSWLNFGQNFSYSHEKTMGVGNTNSEFGGPLSSAINLDPTTPAIVYDPSTQPDPGVYTGNPNVVRSPDGGYYGISNQVQQEMTNPLGYAKTRLGQYNWADNFVGSAYVEIMPIKGLKFRSQAGGKQSYWGYEGFSPVFYLSAIVNQSINSLTRQTNKSLYWNVENTLSYTREFGGHNATVLVGQSAYQDLGATGQGVTYRNIPTQDYNEASFQFGNDPSTRESYAYTNQVHRIRSLFARLNYDYKEKYLVTGIIRADASTRFGSNYRTGKFPSFSLGWVPTKEEFFPESNVINFLKLKAGYGEVGNDNTNGAENLYLSLIGPGGNYVFGNGGQGVTIGNYPSRPANPNLRWEQTISKDVGFEMTLLKNINLDVSFWQKTTSGILAEVNLPGYAGATVRPYGNVLDMRNTGVDIELSYKKKFGDFQVGVSGNLSHFKNKVLGVGADKEFIEGPNVQSTQFGTISRSEPGGEYNAFFGFKTLGIFQNQAEIDSYVGASGTPIQPDAVPGDFKWQDTNGDGVISGDDRTKIGSPFPDFTYGFNINLEYKGFDLNLFAQGSQGNDIYVGYRRLEITTANWQSEALNRWTGEGTSNTYPRLTANDPNGNFSRASDFKLKDGSYMRFKTVQIGYSLPKSVLDRIGLAKARFYATGENLFTFTKYNGYDPEIGGDVFGIDRGYYPQARSYMFGVNLQL
ncbi:SusC/RagA family TonB-linked outer membrane protein [Flavobacterium silvaticum]|uniref:TonB-dependent receptor n=1 Tax=Flavobacterium silvaticum TaxID=1852020 RepID=A0A972FQT3_9FLAO|nr:TonB-dependent receptor [Flavobacterium silvaticum]NMH29665.1 TonB-dependent receptor [Flavobacterium silvaticum]